MAKINARGTRVRCITTRTPLCAAHRGARCSRPCSAHKFTVNVAVTPRHRRLCSAPSSALRNIRCMRFCACVTHVRATAVVYRNLLLRAWLPIHFTILWYGCCRQRANNRVARNAPNAVGRWLRCCLLLTSFSTMTRAGRRIFSPPVVMPLRHA